MLSATGWPRMAIWSPLWTQKSDVLSDSMEVQTLHSYTTWCLWTLAGKYTYFDMLLATTFQTADCFEAMYGNHRQIFILQTPVPVEDSTTLVVCYCLTAPVHTVLSTEGIC